MKCDFCSADLPEPQMQESHDVPCYLFKGFNRNEKKNQADKFGRHWLCKSCHEKYEESLRLNLVNEAAKYAEGYFK